MAAFHRQLPLSLDPPSAKAEQSSNKGPRDSGYAHRAKSFVPTASVIVDNNVRGCSQMRVNGMDPSKEDKGNQDEKHDRADKEAPRLIPVDVDIDEGDEEKREETDLPPAMPPKV